MGFFKKIMEEEKMMMQAVMVAEETTEAQRRMSTCKICEKIFSEGYPYQRTMFGKPKNYVCKGCAKKIGLPTQ